MGSYVNPGSYQSKHTNLLNKSAYIATLWLHLLVLKSIY